MGAETYALCVWDKDGLKVLQTYDEMPDLGKRGWHKPEPISALAPPTKEQEDAK